jgi:acetyltransferase-like isoleucine patch superfamily enzyme
MNELRRSAISRLTVRAYGWQALRRLCLAFCRKYEGGEFYSGTLRDILQKYHGVTAGAYSYGEGLIPEAFPAGVTIGRYTSIATGVQILLRNHPLDFLSLHPFFFNHQLGWIKQDPVPFGKLEIGHDAWIGSRAIITPSCKRIGIGAVVGAGSVVTKDVPDYAVVAGNPAKLIRNRFDDQTTAAILKSKWWEKPIAEVAEFLPWMTKPVGPDTLGQAFLSETRPPNFTE